MGQRVGDVVDGSGIAGQVDWVRDDDRVVGLGLGVGLCPGRDECQRSYEG